ncbi:cubilin-like [Haliotis rubra]|uniref:cubilin-like n=1 Tax=Haliotis rubra TaxID=36100 RepID=UPI001EE5068F|nr:cubilin-like [Haliotis rubra]
MAVNAIAVMLLAVLLPLRDTNADACGNYMQLSNLTKSITSPGYPSLYNSSLSCEWRINASSPDHLVGVLYVAQFESKNCQHGSLSFYDGSDNSSGLLLQLCGTDRGGILSCGNTMYIQFTSSASSYGTSFVLTANNTERCRGTFIATPQMTNFTIPGIPYVSYRNLNCKWIITSANENHTVQVKSRRLVYFGPSSQSCTCDVVRVYNGNTTEADQFLGEYCSTQMPNFYSSKNSLLLVLTTDANTTSFGLQMQYSSRPEGHCSRTHSIYNTPIYILSPGYPSSYGSNRTCRIYLNGIISPNMRLDVLTADMEGTYPQCDTESVRLFAATGDMGSNYLAGKICGNSSISPIGPYYSNGLFKEVVFKSNSDTKGMAFRIRVSPTSRKVIPHQSDNCGPQFRNATAHPNILSSPGYPGMSGYEDNCIWKVTASNPKMMVRIVVIDSDVPFFEWVRCDYSVTFYNGPSIFNDTIFSWCGDSKPTLQSTGSAMTIQFQTRYYSSDLKGFRLKYFTTNETYRCGGTVNVTTVGNRTLTGQYENSQDCHWTIHAPANMAIQVKVTNLNPYVKPMAPPKTCNADYVEIYDGSFDNISSSTGKWCGQYSEGFIN